jgi:hypothetical protein
MLLDFHSAQPPAIIAPAPESSPRDEFPSCRNWGAGQPKPAGCAAPQLRQYWIDLSRQVIDPEHGPMLESLVIDAEIHAGYLPQDGGGEVARLTALVAATMPGWTITGLSLADDPGEEF